MKTKKEVSLYFLAVIPDGTIREDIMGFKNEVFERYNSKAALKSPPHITLHMPFKWRADREQQLIETLSNFRFDTYPIAVELEGFDFFEPRVVFVNVKKSEVLAKLQKELIRFLRHELHILNADYKDRGFHPHVTIGFRDLKKSVFPQVKSDFESKTYQANFEVNNFCLLKHDGVQWQEFRYY